VRVVGRLLSALGARHIVIADALWPEREAIAGRVEENGVRLSDTDWAVVAGNLRAASDAAAEFGLRCVFHHHAGAYVETPGELRGCSS
jgi:inosose dehydratase